MSVYNALWGAIYSKLNAATALTSLLSGTTAIYNMVAPDDAPMPYVVFQNYGGGAENINPSDMRNQPMLIKAYAASAATAGSIDAQVHTAILAGLSVSGYTNFWVSRDLDVTTVDVQPSGEKAYMAGAVYRIRLTD